MIKQADGPGMKTVSKETPLPSKLGRIQRGSFLLGASSSLSSSSDGSFGIRGLGIFTNRSAVSLFPSIGDWKG